VYKKIYKTMDHRRRKGNKKSSHKHVTFRESEEKYNKSHSGIFNTLKTNKLVATFSLVILLILLNAFWPSPKLSIQVAHWRDSGYHFKYNNHVIFYRSIYEVESRVAHDPVLLILHGFPTSSYDWRVILPKLQKRFPNIILPDFLGLGFSDKPAPYEYTVMEQANIIESLLTTLNITNVHILSHDYGDTIAQELLARQQDVEYIMKFKIKSLCLTNGGIIPSQHKPRPIQKLMIMPGVKNVLSYFMNRFVFYSRFGAVFGPNTQPTKDEFYDFYSIFAFNVGHRASSYVLMYIPERHENEARWVGALEKTNLPLHLIYGPLDPVNTPDGFLKHYKDQVPHSSVTVLDGIAHYPQVEAPGRFIKSFNQFLDRMERDYYPL